MKATELLKTVAAHSGVSFEDAGLQQLIGNKALDALEVDEEVAKRMTAPRMTMETAKANPDLKRYFTAAALDGVDSKVKALLDSEELPEEFRVSLNTGNTYDKVAAITKEILDLKNTRTASNQHTVNKEIIRLSDELKKSQELMAKQATDFEVTRHADRTNWEMDKVYSTFLNQLALDEKIPASIRLGAAKQAIATRMTERGISVQLSPEGSLELMTKEGTPYIPETNVRPTIDDFVKSTLLENGLLQTRKETQGPAARQAPTNINNAAPSSDRAAVAKRMAEHSAEVSKQFGLTR